MSAGCTEYLKKVFPSLRDPASGREVEFTQPRKNPSLGLIHQIDEQHKFKIVSCKYGFSGIIRSTYFWHQPETINGPDKFKLEPPFGLFCANKHS